MIPNLTMNGNIKEFCIACLTKTQNMLSLNENTQKRSLFANLFNIELAKYKEYPQFLCCICDIKLNVTHNFQETVKRSLTILGDYNENLSEPNIDYKQHKQEDTTLKNLQDITGDAENVLENENQTSKCTASQRVGGNKIEAVPIEVVNKVADEFKTKLTEKKTCPLCGFIAANRRAISSHMAILHKEKKHSWCLDCNQIFENYEEHKQTHNNKYKCPFCNKETTSSHYVEHLQTHAGIFQCEYCSKTFKSATWLKNHTRIHTNDKPYICPNCSKCFIQISSLRYHVNTHGKFLCGNCKKRYKTDEELTIHQCVSHKSFRMPDEIWISADDGDADNEEIGERVIVKKTEGIDCTESQNFCKECNKRVRSLSQHTRKYHTLADVQEKPRNGEFQCEFCHKTFNNSYKLKVHLRTHTGELPYKCKYCDRRILNRSRLKVHERTHTKEKPYICNICGKGLSQPSALRTHMRQHTGRPEVCELCNKRFCRKSELRLHLSKHMGEKPFLCTECGKTFAQRSHLMEHMAGHGDARPYQCPYCQKAFKKEVLLKGHIKLHRGYKPFKCPSCSYACYKAYRLQQHMKQHSADPYKGVEQVQIEEEPSCVPNVESDQIPITNT